MDKNKEQLRRPMYLVNTLLLMTHILLLLFFSLTHITLMVCVNVFSVATYIVLYVAIKNDKSRAYIISTTVEIIVHMALAVVCVGWDSGFWLYFYGCMGMVFYADYFVSRAKLKRVNTICLSVVCAVSLFGCLIVSRLREPVYTLEGAVATVVLVINATITFTFIAVLFWLLIDRALYYQGELERQANYDRLTGLVNRNYLIEHLQALYGQEDLSNYWLAIIDIDDFKGINDTYGHNGGDYVLKGVADLIMGNCGKLTACRWGGEEFILVGQAEECLTGSSESVCSILERIRAAVEDYDFNYEGQKINITITIGVAVHMQAQSIDEWINVADKKLYLGKQTGKNKLIF